MKYLILLIFITSISFSQTEIKKIRSTREKIEFINDSIQNYKLFSMDGDYGLSGFTGPKYTIKRFHQHWYNQTFVHYINNVRFFDDKGKLVEEHWFDKKNDTLGSYKYFYTEFDSLSRTITYNRFDDIKVENISYNHFKKKQSELNYWQNDSKNFRLEQFGYDENLNLKKKTLIYEEGLSDTHFYNYDKNNLLTEIIVNVPLVWDKYDSKSFYQRKDSIGTTYLQSKFIYNDKKQLIKKIDFSAPDYNSVTELKNTTFYEYDSFGNVIETTNIRANSKTIFKNVKKYNSDVKIILDKDFTLNFESSLDNEKEYFYNRKNELKKLIVRENKFKAIVTFDYKYDEFGNWIEQTKFYNGKKLFVWKREITYY